MGNKQKHSKRKISETNEQQKEVDTESNEEVSAFQFQNIINKYSVLFKDDFLNIVNGEEADSSDSDKEIEVSEDEDNQLSEEESEADSDNLSDEDIEEETESESDSEDDEMEDSEEQEEIESSGEDEKTEEQEDEKDDQLDIDKTQNTKVGGNSTVNKSKKGKTQIEEKGKKNYLLYMINV